MPKAAPSKKIPVKSSLSSRLVNGVTFPPDWSPLHVELYLFREGRRLAADPFWRPPGALDPNPAPQPYIGSGRYEHAANLNRMLWPESFEMHDWSIAAEQSFCEHDSCGVTGCGGSSKSTSAAAYALKFFLSAPADTGVLIASTSIDGAKRRIWKPLASFFAEFMRKSGSRDCVMTGNPRPSICPLKNGKRDESSGIHVVAVEGGEIEKAIQKLKGFHPRRLLIIGDETDSISQAIVDVCVNLQIGTHEFQTIWLGNDPSMFNPLGRLMEPEKGKPVTMGHHEWTSTSGVHCLRFDGMDSPNLRDADKWTGIIRQKDIDSAIRQYGGDNTPQFWIMVRGLHPPEGADDTILSEALFLRHGCAQGVVWASSFTLSAALDPAFGGDRCIFRTFARGLDTEGKMRVLLMEVIALSIRADDPSNPAEYQIAAQVQALSEARSIGPEEFAMDSTGTGRGVASVLQREWSPLITLCEFGGRPSAMPVSQDDPRPATELYDRKVTELMFSFREFVSADMIRGLDPATAIEACQRRFLLKGTGSGKRTSVESKTEMKARGLQSCDNLDALCVGIHHLREKGVHAAPQGQAVHDHSQKWTRALEKADIDSHPDCYSADFEVEFA